MVSLTAAIALGSNLGERLSNIRAAVDALEERGVLAAIEVAPVYESEPMYLSDQPAFLNTVVVGETGFEPFELLAALKALEADLGREKSIRNGPRLIDLDIVFLGDRVVSLKDLEIPHPRLRERPFVLRPLADIRPDWRDPVTGQTAVELSGALFSDPATQNTLRRIAESLRGPAIPPSPQPSPASGRGRLTLARSREREEPSSEGGG